MVKRQNIVTILLFDPVHRLGILSLMCIKILNLFNFIRISYKNILQKTLLLAPDVVAIDITACNNSNYLSLITRIRESSPRTRVFIIADNATQAFGAVQNGASSYAYTSSSSYAVARKMYNAVNDRCSIDSEMASHILAYADKLILRERYLLTQLQEELLFLIAKKESARKVRKELDILKSDFPKITGDILLKVSEHNHFEYDTSYNKPRTSIYHHRKVSAWESHFPLWIKRIGISVLLRRVVEHTIYYLAKWFKETDCITILYLCIIGLYSSFDNTDHLLQR